MYAVVTVGSPVLERFRVTTAPVGVAEADVVKRTITGDITIKAGESLQRVCSKAKHQACSQRGPCGLGDDGDRRFDRIAPDDVVRALRLDEPLPYRIDEVEVATPSGNFRQVVSYLGVSGSSPRLSFREFLNDMARPAFTEELTFPLASAYPQPVAFKDTRITVLGIDGGGMSIGWRSDGPSITIPRIDRTPTRRGCVSCRPKSAVRLQGRRSADRTSPRLERSACARGALAMSIAASVVANAGPPATAGN